MSYADFDFYTNTYLGALIAQADFDRLALRASEQIDRMTFQRAAAVVEAGEDADTIALIGMATCAIAERIQDVEAEGGADAIQSERVGNHSVTYAETSSRRLTAGQKYEEAGNTYLASTGLMYRGFAAGEYGGVPSAD
jgi:hypothetical protein